MGGTAPANQLRLSFTGSEDGEAETETCRAANPLRRNDDFNLTAFAGLTYGTAVCGPACTVVWEGRVGDRSPCPD